MLTGKENQGAFVIRATWGFVAAGVFLRLLQYLGNTSLWMDEAMLASSIVERSALELLREPLDYGQVAPPIFLLAAKAAGMVFGHSEYALRGPALISSLAALLLFVKLARLTLSGSAVPLAIGLFALSPALVDMAAEVKQYSTDVVAVLVMTVASLRIIRSEYDTRSVFLAALAGVCVVWISQPVVMGLAGLGITAAVIAVRRRDDRAARLTLVLLIVWGIASAAAVIHARGMIELSAYAFMRQYWATGFMPFPPDSLEDVIWPWRMVRGVYWNALNLKGVATFALMAGTWGVVSFWRRGRGDIAMLLVLPVVATFAVSAARVYPFSGRLVLFLLPAMILALAEGAHSAASMIPGRVTWLKTATPLIFLVPATFAIARDMPPWPAGEMKPALLHVVARRQPGDVIYVSGLSVPAMKYYAPRSGLHPRDWIAGVTGGANAAHYVAEADRLAGKGRVWLLFTHDEMLPEARPAMTRHLDSVGVRLDSAVFHERMASAGSKVYLYALR